MDDADRQRKREQKEAYARELEAQIANNKRRRDRDRAEQEERDRREEQIALSPTRTRQGGGGEPVRASDGTLVANLKLLNKDPNTEDGQAQRIGGELLERTKAVSVVPPGHDLIERTKPGIGSRTRGSYVRVGYSRGGVSEPDAADRPTTGRVIDNGRGGLKAMYDDGRTDARTAAALAYQRDLEDQIMEGKSRRAQEKAKNLEDEARLDAKLGVGPAGGWGGPAQHGRRSGPPFEHAALPSTSRAGVPPQIPPSAPPGVPATGDRGPAAVMGGARAGAFVGGGGGGRRITQPLDVHSADGGLGGLGPIRSAFAENGGFDGYVGGTAAAADSEIAAMRMGAADGPVIAGFTREQQLVRLLEWERERAKERERERERERDREREREGTRQREMERMMAREKEIERRVREEEEQKRASFERRMADESAHRAPACPCPPPPQTSALPHLRSSLRPPVPAHFVPPHSLPRSSALTRACAVPA